MNDTYGSTKSPASFPKARECNQQVLQPRGATLCAVRYSRCTSSCDGNVHSTIETVAVGAEPVYERPQGLCFPPRHSICEVIAACVIFVVAGAHARNQVTMEPAGIASRKMYGKINGRLGTRLKSVPNTIARRLGWRSYFARGSRWPFRAV